MDEHLETIRENEAYAGCGRRLDGGFWICDTCESMWSITLADTGYRPRMCRERRRVSC